MLVAGFLFFCLGLIFMFFDLMVVIWGFFFPVGFFLCFFAKKIYGFEGQGLLYWGYGFGVLLGSGFRVCFLPEIDYREKHK